MAIRRAEQVSLTAAHADRTGWERIEQTLALALALSMLSVLALVLAWVVLPWVSLEEPDEVARRRRMQKLVASACRRVQRLLRTLGLHHDRYADVALPTGPALLVARHPCLLDLLGLVGRLPSVCCVVRDDLVNSRVVGPVLKSCGHVGAGTASAVPGAGWLAMQTRMSEGFPVLVCSEPAVAPSAEPPSLSVHDTGDITRAARRSEAEFAARGSSTERSGEKRT